MGSGLLSHTSQGREGCDGWGKGRAMARGAARKVHYSTLTTGVLRNGATAQFSRNQLPRNVVRNVWFNENPSLSGRTFRRPTLFHWLKSVRAGQWGHNNKISFLISLGLFHSLQPSPSSSVFNSLARKPRASAILYLYNASQV